jgi:hypothetical protein
MATHPIGSCETQVRRTRRLRLDAPSASPSTRVPEGTTVKRPCLACGRLIPRGSYCRRCDPRGTSARQAKFRRVTLAMTGGKCARCGTRDGVQAHHVRALQDGGRDQDGGLPLCVRCHRLAHRVG